MSGRKSEQEIHKLHVPLILVSPAYENAGLSVRVGE